jgi:hypothetical protein
MFSLKRVTPLPHKPSLAKLAARSVFVDHLAPHECDMNVIKQRMSCFGDIVRVDVVRRGGVPRGFVFVEFAQGQALFLLHADFGVFFTDDCIEFYLDVMALRAAHHSSWSPVGSPLFGWRVLTQNEYTRRKVIYRELINPPPATTITSAATDDNDAVDNASTADTVVRPKKKMPMSAAPLEPGRLLIVNGIDAAVSTADVRAEFESVALVAYIDRHADDRSTVIVRYYTSADRNTAVAKLADKFPSIRAMVGQEENDYLALAEQQKATRRAELEQAKLNKQQHAQVEETTTTDDAVAKKKRRNKRKTPKSQHIKFGADDGGGDDDDDNDDDDQVRDQSKKRSTTE